MFYNGDSDDDDWMFYDDMAGLDLPHHYYFYGLSDNSDFSSDTMDPFDYYFSDESDDYNCLDYLEAGGDIFERLRHIAADSQPHRAYGRQEILWENLYYLRELFKIATKRCLDSIESNSASHDDSSSSMFVTMGGDLISRINIWFIFVDDILIDILQKLLSIHLPYTAWKLILHHLSNQYKLSEFKKCAGIVPVITPKELDLRIETYTDNEELVLSEKILIRDAVEVCITLNHLMTMHLFSNRAVKQELIQTIPGAVDIMEIRLAKLYSFLKDHFPELPGQSMVWPSMRIDVTQEKLFTNYDLKFSARAKGIVLANSMFQNPTYLCAASWFDNGCYKILCFDINELRANNVRKIYRSITSEDNVQLHTVGKLFGIIYQDPYPIFEFYDLNVVESYWDDFSPVKLPLSTYAQRLKEKVDDVSFVSKCVVVVKSVGLCKINDSDIFAFFSLAYLESKKGYNDETSQVEIQETVVLKLNEKSFEPYKFFTDCFLLAVHDNFLFIIEAQVAANKSYLMVLDIAENFKELHKLQWDNGNPWSVRFNHDRSKNTFLLYRINDYQLRNLDSQLSFVQDLKIANTNSASTMVLQLFGNVIYGCYISNNLVINDFLLSIDDDGVPNTIDYHSNVHFEHITDFSCLQPAISWSGMNMNNEIVKLKFWNMDLRDDIAYTINTNGKFGELPESHLKEVQRIREIEKVEKERMLQVREYCNRKTKELESNLSRMDYFHANVSPSETFTSTIKAWKHANSGYGFGNVSIKGIDQAVYFHTSEFKNARRKIRPGLRVRFKLRWSNAQHPRPKAFDIYIID